MSHDGNNGNNGSGDRLTIAVPELAAGDDPVRCFAAPRLVTCDPARATATDPLGAIEQGAVAVHGGKIVGVGTESEMRARFPGATWRLSFESTLITPGLVDAHTHAAWAGSRDAE